MYRGDKIERIYNKVPQMRQPEALWIFTLLSAVYRMFFLFDRFNLMCFSRRIQGYVQVITQNLRQIGFIFLQSQFLMKFWR